MLSPPLPHHHSRRRSATRHTAARWTVLDAHAASVPATLILALVAIGLIALDAFEGAWRWLVEMLLLALLALAFFVAARRSDDQRFAWLLSASVAAGLAIAAFYNLILATATPALPVAGVATFVAITLFLLRRGTRQPPRG